MDKIDILIENYLEGYRQTGEFNQVEMFIVNLIMEKHNSDEVKRQFVNRATKLDYDLRMTEWAIEETFTAAMDKFGIKMDRAKRGRVVDNFNTIGDMTECILKLKRLG